MARLAMSSLYVSLLFVIVPSPRLRTRALTEGSRTSRVGSRGSKAGSRTSQPQFKPTAPMVQRCSCSEPFAPCGPRIPTGTRGCGSFSGCSSTSSPSWCFWRRTRRTASGTGRNPRPAFPKCKQTGTELPIDPHHRLGRASIRLPDSWGLPLRCSQGQPLASPYRDTENGKGFRDGFGMMPPRLDELEPGRAMGDSDGVVLVLGIKGVPMCGCHGKNPRLIPEAVMKEYHRPTRSMARIPEGQDGHERDWVRACKGTDSSGNKLSIQRVCHALDPSRRSLGARLAACTVHAQHG